MFTPRPQRKASTLRRWFGSYHIAQLSANPDLVAETEAFAAAQDALDQKILAYDHAVEENLKSLAARDRASVELTESIRSFGHFLRRIVLNDTNAPLYRAYFPNGMPHLTQAPIAVLASRVEGILTKLANETRPELREQHDVLNAALTQAREALRAREQTFAEQARASAALNLGKHQWIAAYRASRGRLLQHFSNEPRRVEMYFRKVSHSVVDETEDVEAIAPVDESDAQETPTAGGAGSPSVETTTVES